MCPSAHVSAACLPFLVLFVLLKLNDFHFKNGHWAAFNSACKAERSFKDTLTPAQTGNFHFSSPSCAFFFQFSFFGVCPYVVEKILLTIFITHLRLTKKNPTQIHAPLPSMSKPSCSKFFVVLGLRFQFLGSNIWRHGRISRKILVKTCCRAQIRSRWITVSAFCLQPV